MDKKYKSLFICFFLLIFTTLFAFESYENKLIRKLDISIESADSNTASLSSKIRNRLTIQEGSNFSQISFDDDLKKLSADFDKVEPKITLEDNKLNIQIKLWPKPQISSIIWQGNKKIKTTTLKKELGIKPFTIFDKEKFHKALNKVKEYYIKKGYFESELTYKVFPLPQKDEITITITVKEGRLGKIKNIIFKGFTKKEKNTLLGMMYTKKYNPLTSWLTGIGIFREEAIEQDHITILDHLQNKGYADATVEINIHDDPTSHKIIIEIVAHRGTLYRFGKITYEGNSLFPDDVILSRFLIHPDDIFSPEKIRNTAQAIRDLYGQKGYIEAQVYYDTHLKENESIYNVDFHIEEGEIFKIGMIHIIGNTQTQANVILRESLLVPGETFNSRKLKATQIRLEKIGYFKNVNVYAVRTSDEIESNTNYRDVYIEVEETTTGSVSLFLGFSTMDDIFGGLELTEKNFNYKGFGQLFKEGPSALRGGGEYAHAKVSLGAKQRNYLISWLTPYLRDSLWRLGIETSLTQSKLQSKDYAITTYGFSISTSYPLTSFWTFGSKYRLRNGRVKIDQKDKDESSEAKKLEENKGLISALGSSITYDTTDDAYKAHKGLRSWLDIEYVGIGGDYNFFKFMYVNALYQSLWSKGVMKYRADFKFIEPISNKPIDKAVPLNERYFLGGETTVRGYKPFILGPHLRKNNDNTENPVGGLSSILLSVEYSQEITSMLDIFIFADGGSISKQRFSLHKINTSYGIGARLEIMNRMPITLGVGFPINPDRKSDVRKFFIQMGGLF